MISVSPLSGKKYDIPEQVNDKENIDAFLARNADKKVVVVQGLGFVGAVMSLVVANALFEDYAVIGVDLPREHTYWKIKSINEGEFPVVADDPKIEIYFQESRKKGNFYATYDPYCYAKADVVIIDINLDVDKKSNEWKDLEGYGVDMTGFKKAIESIGANCKEDILVLVETTVPPGTSQKIVKPILEESFSKRGLDVNKLSIGHSYERVMPGPKYVDSIQNFYRVYSGVNEASADITEKFLRTIIRTDEYPLTRLGNTNATEMAKVLENSFRAMNIAFIVEWSRFAEEAGVDIFEVVKAIRMRPTHKNIMLPGLGVGGYCLTKDPLLASWAKKELFQSETGLGQSEKGVMINDKMPLYAFNFLKRQYPGDLKGKRVLLLGVSYLNDVGDTRYTPVEPLYDYLKMEGCDILTHDPHVRLWEERDIRPGEDMFALLDEEPDVVIISTGHKEYRKNPKLIERLLTLREVFVYDTIGVFSKEEINTIKKMHSIKILGRGDI